MTDSPLRLEGVSHRFGQLDVVSNITLDVRAGEFVGVVGPSGCGKTTLLQLISGQYRPTAGTVRRPGKVHSVYQHDGLFPWLTVSQNIVLGLEDSQRTGDDKRPMQDLVDLIGLRGFEGAYPHQLSGGMRQRVQLARALAGDSDLLLMDEPFSAVDHLTRLRLCDELVRVLAHHPRTVIYVTHDTVEAAQLAQRVVVLTDRPASLVCEVELPTPRPRRRTERAVIEVAEQIRAALERASPRTVLYPGA